MPFDPRPRLCCYGTASGNSRKGDHAHSPALHRPRAIPLIIDALVPAARPVQPAPNPSGTKDIILLAVSCSSAKACTAVGSYGEGAGGSTLAERWNGTKWALQSTPNPVTGTDGSELLGVSCSSDTSCTAVGDSNISDSKSDTLAEHWNGTKWAIQAAPKPPSETSLS